MAILFPRVQHQRLYFRGGVTSFKELGDVSPTAIRVVPNEYIGSLPHQDVDEVDSSRGAADEERSHTLHVSGVDGGSPPNELLDHLHRAKGVTLLI